MAGSHRTGQTGQSLKLQLCSKMSWSSRACNSGEEAHSDMPATRARSTSSFFATSSLDSKFGEKMRPSLIVGLLYFLSPLDADLCRKLLAERLLPQHSRFRSKAILRGVDVYFQEIPLESIDLEYHVQEVDARGWKQSNVDGFISDLYRDNMAVDMPLWKFYVLNNLASGKSCLIASINHCIGDGVAMVQVLMSILDRNMTSSLPPSKIQDLAGNKDNAISKNSPQSAQLTLPVVDRVVTFIKGVLLAFTGSILPGDTPNPLKLKDPLSPGVERRCAFGEKISLSKVKEIKNKLRGTTVNDILSAVLNMSIKRYYQEECGQLLNQRVKIRAMFPINMRKKEENVIDSLGNRISSGVFEFIFRYSSRIDLVWKLKRQVDVMKLSPQPIVELFMLEVLYRVLSGISIIRLTLTTFGKFTMVLSNVAGPSEVARFAGQDIDDLAFVACSPIGTYCGLLSYNGQVSCGICCDPSTEKNPSKVTKYWKEEFESLYAEVMAIEGVISPPSRRLWETYANTIIFILLISFIVAFSI